MLQLEDKRTFLYSFTHNFFQTSDLRNNVHAATRRQKDISVFLYSHFFQTSNPYLVSTCIVVSTETKPTCLGVQNELRCIMLETFNISS